MPLKICLYQCNFCSSF